MYTIFWASLKILEGGLRKEYNRSEDFKICLDVTSLKFDNLTLIWSNPRESRWLKKKIWWTFYETFRNSPFHTPRLLQIASHVVAIHWLISLNKRYNVSKSISVIESLWCWFDKKSYTIILLTRITDMPVVRERECIWIFGHQDEDEAFNHVSLS